MKKCIPLLAVSVLLLLLSACGSTEPSGTGDGLMDVTDASKSMSKYPGEATALDFDRSFSSADGIFCATEDTVYFAVDRLIYYSDKATGITAPLCGKPECNHDNADCNAYYGVFLFGLSNYDGRLYWVNSQTGYSWIVYSCAYDGTDRRVVRELDRDIVGNIFNITYICFHRGYLYWSCLSNEVVDSVPKSVARVFAFPLDPDEEGYVILDHEPAVYARIQPYLGGVYIDVDYNERVGGYLNYYHTICRWDIETRELEELYKGEPDFSCAGKIWVMDDGILLCGTSIVTNEDGTVSETGPYEYQSMVYKYWFENGEMEALYRPVPTGTMHYAVADGIIIGNDRDSDRITQILKDFDGNTIQETTIMEEEWFAPIASKVMGITMLGVDEDYIYYCYSGIYLSEHIVAIPFDGSENRLLWAGDE